MADTSLMPILVTTDSSPESTEPDAAGGAETPQDGLAPERLRQVVGRIDSGFYDSAEVRERIARRVDNEL